MSDGEFVAFVVDDDRKVLKSLSRLLKVKGYEVRTYDSGQAFLDHVDPDVPGCAILDMALPDISGLDIQQQLLAHDINRPIIFLSGQAEVPASVLAMKSGAVDFLTKPARASEILAALSAARERQRQVHESKSEFNDLDQKFNTLTPREKEVLVGAVSGLLNKQIAAQLGISIKTVKLHRSKMMHKMSVRTIADLVRIAGERVWGRHQ